MAGDLTVGLILLPEFIWTRARRIHGKRPAALATVGSPIAERALDGLAGAFERHGRIKAPGRPPVVWAALLCLASLGLHWLMLRPGAHGAAALAAKAWNYWSLFSHWAQSG